MRINENYRGDGENVMFMYRCRSQQVEQQESFSIPYPQPNLKYVTVLPLGIYFCIFCSRAILVIVSYLLSCGGNEESDDFGQIKICLMN